MGAVTVLSDINKLDAVVRQLGIAESPIEPADAVRKLQDTVDKLQTASAQAYEQGYVAGLRKARLSVNECDSVKFCHHVLNELISASGPQEGACPET